MKKEIAEQWVAALRSDQYPQGRSQLKTADGSFCCLGVLCDISKQGEWDGQSYKVGDFSEYEFPPITVREWAGLRTHIGIINNNSQGEYLTEMNDGGMTFAEIAVVIEHNWQSL